MNAGGLVKLRSTEVDCLVAETRLRSSLVRLRRESAGVYVSEPACGCWFSDNLI
jgi:hypothetical protein